MDAVSITAAGVGAVSLTSAPSSIEDLSGESEQRKIFCRRCGRQAKSLNLLLEKKNHVSLKTAGRITITSHSSFKRS